MQREEISTGGLTEGVRVVLFRGLVQGENLNLLFSEIIDEFPSEVSEATLFLKGQTPLEVLLGTYANFFSKGGFQTHKVTIEKYSSKTAQQEGLFLFLGHAQLTLGLVPEKLLSVSFGDMISITKGQILTSVTSDKGRMFVVHFSEIKMSNQSSKRYPDEKRKGLTRLGETSPSGNRIGEWVIESEPDAVEYYYAKGRYDENGERTGIWIETGRTFRGVEGVKKGEYVSGKKEGPWISAFDETFKTITEEGSYHQGVRSGPWKLWTYHRGWELGNFLNGRRTGLWTEYTNKGNKFSEETFLAGKKSGPATKQWHDSEKGTVGGKAEEGQYLNDRQTGTWYRWNQDGSAAPSITY